LASDSYEARPETRHLGLKLKYSRGHIRPLRLTLHHARNVNIIMVGNSSQTRRVGGELLQEPAPPTRTCNLRPTDLAKARYYSLQRMRALGIYDSPCPPNRSPDQKSDVACRHYLPFLRAEMPREECVTIQMMPLLGAEARSKHQFPHPPLHPMVVETVPISIPQS
jgi:hypothetical protein